MQKLLSILFISFLVACEGTDPVTPAAPGPGFRNTNGQDWLVPVSQVFDVLGRDGIPSLSNPNLVEAVQAGFLPDTELVVGYFDGTTAIAYPHRVLDWHEIINQDLNNEPIAITYCPLTGTAIGWTQKVDNGETEFGVSGLLYNNNLIAFDRNSNTNWSQMSLKAVNGPLAGAEMPTFQVVETTWARWKEMYPNTKVVSTNTGWDRPYGTYPYDDFRTNHNNLFFPLSIDDGRLERKERVHGIIINGSSKVFRFQSFGADHSIISDTFQGEELVIVGNDREFMVSFYAQLPDGTTPNLSPINQRRAILTDDQGNTWDIFGLPVDGALQTPLTATQSFMGYWFAWGAFYPNPEIHGL